MLEVFTEHGLPSSLYTERGSHYFFTPEAGGKVDKERLAQVGRALKQLGIEHIPAYSPEARGRWARNTLSKSHASRRPARRGNLHGFLHPQTFLLKLIPSLLVFGIRNDAIDRTRQNALRFFEIADAFRTFFRVNDEGIFTGKDRVIGTFRFTCIAVDAVRVDQ